MCSRPLKERARGRAKEAVALYFTQHAKEKGELRV